MKNISFLSGLFGEKCPRCRVGEIYTHRAYSLKFTKMHTCCPQCGHRYEKEPGFFDGAMYVSYGMNVALFVNVLIITYLIIGRQKELMWVYMVNIMGVNLTLIPVLFRFSRVLYMYIFGGVNYEPEMSADDYQKKEECE